jgi:hypothetical protein
MIEVILFYMHIVFFAYVYAKNFVENNATGALLSTIFVVIIFTVGWTFTSFVIGMFIPDDGLNRILTKAAFSLDHQTPIVPNERVLVFFRCLFSYQNMFIYQITSYKVVNFVFQNCRITMF